MHKKLPNSAPQKILTTYPITTDFLVNVDNALPVEENNCVFAEVQKDMENNKALTGSITHHNKSMPSI